MAKRRNTNRSKSEGSQGLPRPLSSMFRQELVSSIQLGHAHGIVLCTGSLHPTCCLLMNSPVFFVQNRSHPLPFWIALHTICRVLYCPSLFWSRSHRKYSTGVGPQLFPFPSLSVLIFTWHLTTTLSIFRKFAPRCSVCKEPIMPAPGQEETVRIVALDRDFHVHCYRCEVSGIPKSEQSLNPETLVPNKDLSAHRQFSALARQLITDITQLTTLFIAHPLSLYILNASNS